MGIKDRLDKIRKKLASKKSSRSSSFKTAGLGVEKTCEITGLPAHQIDNLPNTTAGKLEKMHLNEEIIAKQKAFDEFSVWFYKSLLPEEEGCRFARKESELGAKKGESSTVGLIAIDGNKMGAKLKRFFKDQADINDEEYKKNYIQFTQELDKKYRTAMKNVVGIVKQSLENLKKEGLVLKDKVIPIIHIVLSGDDITFMVDGRITIECARLYLEQLSDQKSDVSPDFKYRACAGVAIANIGYPYWKLAEIAEDLLKNAKSKIADENVDACVIDWEIIEGDRSDIGFDERFTARPYLIDRTALLENQQVGDDNFDEFFQLSELTEFNKLSKFIGVQKLVNELSDQNQEKPLANSAKSDLYRKLPEFQDAKAKHAYAKSFKDKDKQEKIGKLICKNSHVLHDVLEVDNFYIQFRDTDVENYHKSKGGENA